MHVLKHDLPLLVMLVTRLRFITSMASSLIDVLGSYSDLKFIYSAELIDVRIAQCGLLRKSSYHFETFHKSVWLQMLYCHYFMVTRDLNLAIISQCSTVVAVE